MSSPDAEFTPSTLAAISLSARGSGVVKQLRGFRKDRHTVPDAVNPATSAFFARLCAEELAAEAEDWFQRARAAFGYKRKELTLDLGAAHAVLTGRDFTLELQWALDPADAANYTTTRTLSQVREAAFLLSPACDAVFAGAFTDIVFTLARGVAIEAVIDAVEDMADASAMTVHYPANCSECTLRVPGVSAEVRCTGATLELGFSSAGSPRELLEEFGRVRAAFRFTQDQALAGLL
jgi:hypothetical protein